TATSPRKAGPPEPSTMSPPRMIRSYSGIRMSPSQLPIPALQSLRGRAHRWNACCYPANCIQDTHEPDVSSRQSHRRGGSSSGVQPHQPHRPLPPVNRRIDLDCSTTSGQLLTPALEATEAAAELLLVPARSLPTRPQNWVST